MVKQIYNVIGMHCASCANLVKKRLQKIDGIQSCDINPGAEQGIIEYDENKTSMEQMNTALKPIGYSLVENESKHSMNHDHMNMSGEEHMQHLGVSQTKQQKLDELTNMKNNVIIAMTCVAISAFVMIRDILGTIKSERKMSDMTHEFFHHLMPIIATYILLVIGKNYVVGLRRFFRYGSANMDSLVGLGTVTAFLYSFIVSAFDTSLNKYIDVSKTYYDVTIIVISLVYLGKYLETRSKLHTSDAIEKLLGLQAKSAIVEKDGKEGEVSIDKVMIGDIVIIKPGTKIPLDGVIIEGSTSIDESMITGESMPADKKIGDKVIGSTINKQGYIKIQITAIGKDTVISHIIKLVENAQLSKAPIQDLADKISAVFVPSVFVIAIMSFILWYLFGDFKAGLITFIDILVIACPCALGLATPTGIIVGVGKAAQNGIFIKNAEVLQKFEKINVVVFDKTGTITNGKPTVVDFFGDNQEKNLSILASLEHRSEHPLAKAITDYAQSKNISLTSVENFSITEGKGVQGTIDGKEYIGGSKDYMEENNITYDKKILEKIVTMGGTPVFLTDKKNILCTLAISDTIKADAKNIIGDLHKRGIQTIMLTGDHQTTAEYIAKQVSIDKVYAEVLPDSKGNIIKQLQSEGKKVVMCGDGVNDAVALAQADIGIAMDTGSDVAIETSDVTILKGDISKVLQSIKIASSTMSIIKQNLFRAFAYNIVLIPIAAGVLYPFYGILLNPIFAGAAMALSSVTVVSNSLRLKRKKV